MTVTELDGACESTLRSTFGETLDFAVENCLPDLQRDGLVHEEVEVGLGWR